ncbi:MAG: hypothetical protein AB7N76_04525 [Planctomycetota bacterium]
MIARCRRLSRALRGRQDEGAALVPVLLLVVLLLLLLGARARADGAYSARPAARLAASQVSR